MYSEPNTPISFHLSTYLPITLVDFSSRLAPLNSHSKNWRADLFEGGLIEIKCNEDLVNQKWMWGKVSILHV